MRHIRLCIIARNPNWAPACLVKSRSRLKHPQELQEKGRAKLRRLSPSVMCDRDVRLLYVAQAVRTNEDAEPESEVVDFTELALVSSGSGSARGVRASRAAAATACFFCKKSGED